MMRYIPTAVSRTVARSVLKTQKHSPTLLFAAGVAGVVATTVSACRATLRVEEVLAKTQGDLKSVRTMESVQYTEQDRQRDTAIIYAQAIVELTKLYGPTIILGSLSIGALAGSNRILTRRNAAITAAYAALERGFAEYRQRVSSELGVEKERQLYSGAEACDYVDEKTGKKKKKLVATESSSTSPYAKLFHEGNQNWSPLPDYNIMFLRTKQNYLNDRLHARGHLFLNEAYDELGLERTKQGAVCGWLNNNPNGDSNVDFGIFTDADRNRFWEYVVGFEDEILIDFNCDGPIWDLI